MEIIILWIDKIRVIKNIIIAIELSFSSKEIMINGKAWKIWENRGQGLIILSFEDIISDDKVFKTIFIVGDDDAVSVVLHVEEVVDDLYVGFLMWSGCCGSVYSEAVAVGVDDVVLDGDVWEGSSLFGCQADALSVVVGDVVVDGDVGVVSCLAVDVDAGAGGVMVADGVVGDEAVFTAVFCIDAFFVGVGDLVSEYLEGVGAAEADAFLVHVHAYLVDGVLFDGDVVGVAVSMVDDDAAWLAVLDVVVFYGEVVAGVSGVDAEVLAVLYGEVFDGDVAFVVEVDESSPVEGDVGAVDDWCVAGVCFDGDGGCGCAAVFDDHFFVVGPGFDEEGVAGGDGVCCFLECFPGLCFGSGVVVVSVWWDIVSVSRVCCHLWYDKKRGNQNKYGNDTNMFFSNAIIIHGQSISHGFIPLEMVHRIPIGIVFSWITFIIYIINFIEIYYNN